MCSGTYFKLPFVAVLPQCHWRDSAFMPKSWPLHCRSYQLDPSAESDFTDEMMLIACTPQWKVCDMELIQHPRAGWSNLNRTPLTSTGLDLTRVPSSGSVLGCP